jgi:plastocyanin
MPFRRQVTLVVIGCVLAGCGGKDSSPMTPTPPAGPPAPTTIHIPLGATPLTDTAYVPNPVTVQIGTMVTWINDDNVSHTSTSSVGLWNSGDMPPGSQFSFTFQAAGAFNYLCLVHPNMIGTITVQ